MRELRTAPIVANEVSMLRSAMKGPIVLVEGDSDTRLYREFLLPSPHVRVTHCDGKPVLLEAMTLISKRHIPGVVGICDADFDRILGRAIRPDIMCADFHDAEMMIARSTALKRVFEEIYEIAFESYEFQVTRDYILNLSARIGAIRLWNVENAGHLKFQGINPGEFLDANQQFLREDYIRGLLEQSAASSDQFGQIDEIMRTYRLDVDDSELSCGHDFAALLDFHAAIRESRDPHGRHMIEKMLRLSFNVDCFRETQLAQDLGEWEKRVDIDVLADGALPSEGHQ